MLGRLTRWTIFLAMVAGVAFWWLTRPERIDGTALDLLSGNATRGEAIFWAAGCASCHSAPDASGEDRLSLGGGQQFPSDFGTFLAPNISPDPVAGIGGWGTADFVNAVQRGVSPGGAHYYPVFPYSAYSLAETGDIVDLWAFMQTLPPVATPSLPHRVGFPFNLRRGLGLWKRLFLPDGWTITGDLPPEVARGRYLVEALGHCAECHTPRNALGGLDRTRWLGGAPNPTGQGTIPALTPDILTWSVGDIAAYLNDGFTPDFDSAGGHMVSVIANMAHLPDAERLAIAAYLRALPAR